MKKLLSALFVLALCSSVAFATVPDPSKCSVSPADNLNGVVLCPDSPGAIAATIYTITVKNSSGAAIPNASVAVEFPAPTNIRVCTTAVHTGTTNGSGISVITLKGGGCQRTTVGGTVYAAVVKANGVAIRSYYNSKSPDYDCVGPNGIVNLQDLLCYRNPVVGCHDYDNNGSMNLSDTLIFAPAYSPLHSCTLAP